jgi:hypothetical protein
MTVSPATSTPAIRPLCQGGLLCSPTGCSTFAYAVSSTGLYDIELPSGKVVPIGAPDKSLDDIALDPDGTLYGVDFFGLVSVDRISGTTTTIGVPGAALNALDAAPDGTLYGAGGRTVYLVDRSTGSQTQIGVFPPMLQSSGDIAIVEGQLYASATDASSMPDALVALYTDGTPPRIVGSIGFTCVWGLAAYGPLLYGFTCTGNLISIDVTTGAGTLLAQTGIEFQGASSR